MDPVSDSMWISREFQHVSTVVSSPGNTSTSPENRFYYASDDQDTEWHPMTVGKLAVQTKLGAPGVHIAVESSLYTLFDFSLRPDMLHLTSGNHLGETSRLELQLAIQAGTDVTTIVDFVNAGIDLLIGNESMSFPALLKRSELDFESEKRKMHRKEVGYTK